MLVITKSIFSISGPSTTSRQVFCHFVREIAARGPQLRLIIITNGRSSTTQLRSPLPLLRRVHARVGKVIHGRGNGVSCRRLLMRLGGTTKRMRTLYLTMPFLQRKSCPIMRARNGPCTRKIGRLCTHLLGCTLGGQASKRTLITIKRLLTANSRVTRGSRDRHVVVNNLRDMSPRSFPRRVICATLKRVRGTRHMSNERGVHCTNDPLPVSFTRGRCRRKIMGIALSRN